MAKKKKASSIIMLPFHCMYKIIFFLYLPFYYLLSNLKKYITNEPIDKMSGVEFEQFARLLLQQNGYTNVELTKASNDYGIDIVAMKGNVLYAIQCKKYSSKVGIDAIRQASTGCIYYDHDIAVVLTNSTFTTQAIKLADTLDVELWDKEMLNSLILHSNNAKRRKRKILVCLFILLTTIFYGYYKYAFNKVFIYLFCLFGILTLFTIFTIIFTKKVTY